MKRLALFAHRPEAEDIDVCALPGGCLACAHLPGNKSSCALGRKHGERKTV